ncbi:MAG TPA: zf-HC2 domain-containing protein [Herpetosiphonaceae bacterium]|nr:zf-HC2 domain-containing protein [Herpetosiphonaceae bacterium]
MSTVSETQREQLSAYLDGMLPEAERRQLEQALQADAELAAELRDLQTTAALLRDLPPVRPPRSFTLDPATVAPRRRGLSFAWTRWAAVVGALALFLTVGLSTLTGGGASPNSAPAQSSAGNAAEPAPTFAALAEAAPEDSAAGGAMPAPPMMSAQAEPTQEPLPEAALAAPSGAAPDLSMTLSATLDGPVAGGEPMMGDTQRSSATVFGTTVPESQAAGSTYGQANKALTDTAMFSQSPAGIVAPDLDTTETSSPDTGDLQRRAFEADPEVSPPLALAAPADEVPNLGLLFGLLALAGLLGALALTAAVRRLDRRD